MAWIESHTELERHRKVVLLAADLGISPVHLSGHLHALWHNVLEQQEDGNLSQWPVHLIASAAMWEGDAQKFVESLQQHCFLGKKILLVHDWFDYAGKYLWRKYHTSDPRKLRGIENLYKGNRKVYSRSPKGDQKVPTRRLVGSSSSLNLKEGSAEGGGSAAKATEESFSVKDLAESWNSWFEGVLPQVAWPLAESRHRKAAVRIKEHPGMEFWESVFKNISASEFLTGQRTPWKCTFDWLIANDANVLKVYEGSYANGVANQQRRRVG